MQDARAMRQLAAEHVGDLLADERKVQRTLRRYVAFSHVAVFCGVAVPVLAGSAVLTSVHGIGGLWPVASGLLTLVASVLVAIHKGLDCEAFHARCREALAELRSVAMAYERLLNDLALDDPLAAFDVLEARLGDFYRAFVDVLPVRSTRLSLAPSRELLP